MMLVIIEYAVVKICWPVSLVEKKEGLLRAGRRG